MGLVVNQRGRSKYKCSAHYHGTCSKSERKNVSTSVLLIIMGRAVNQRGTVSTSVLLIIMGLVVNQRRKK